FGLDQAARVDLRVPGCTVRAVGHGEHAVGGTRGCERYDRVGGSDPGCQADAVDPAFCGVADTGHALWEVDSVEQCAVGVHDSDRASAPGCPLCSGCSWDALRPLHAWRPLRAGQTSGALVATQLGADGWFDLADVGDNKAGRGSCAS